MGSLFVVFCLTHHHQAPELISSAGYGKPVDVYAYGILCYELLTEDTTPFAWVEGWVQQKVVLDPKCVCLLLTSLFNNFDDACYD